MNKLLLVCVSTAVMSGCAPFAQIIPAYTVAAPISASIDFPDGVYDGKPVQVQLACDSFDGVLSLAAASTDLRFEHPFMEGRGYEYFAILEGVSDTTIACAIRYNNRTFFGEGRCLDDDINPYIITF
jgi:hypothetical protein